MFKPEYSKKDCIRGINCDVTNCLHNNHQEGCTASVIRVCGPHAHDKQQTVCDSFREDPDCRG